LGLGGAKEIDRDPPPNHFWGGVTTKNKAKRKRPSATILVRTNKEEDGTMRVSLPLPKRGWGTQKACYQKKLFHADKVGPPQRRERLIHILKTEGWRYWRRLVENQNKEGRGDESERRTSRQQIPSNNVDKLWGVLGSIPN